MKKIMAIMVLLAGYSLAQVNIGIASSILGETTGVTNYIGLARTTQHSTATPSPNDAVWRIIKTVVDSSGNVVSVKNAYGAGTGDNSLWTTAWTNRVSATYR